MSYKLFTAFMLPIFISCVSWYFTFIIIIIGWFYWIIMSARQFHQIKFKQLLAFPDCFHSSVLFLLVLVPSVTQKLLCFRFLIRHCWAVGSQPAWSPNSDSRTVHVRPWCLLKAGWYQLSIDQGLGQFGYSIIKFCVYFRWHLKICSSPACNPFLVGSIRGVLPAQPFILSLISTWEIFTTCFALSLKHADGIIHTHKPRSLSHTLKSWTPAESRHPTRAIYWKEQRNCEKC